MILFFFFLKYASLISHEEIWLCNFANYCRLRQLSITIDCSRDKVSNLSTPKCTLAFNVKWLQFLLFLRF